MKNTLFQVLLIAAMSASVAGYARHGQDEGSEGGDEKSDSGRHESAKPDSAPQAAPKRVKHVVAHPSGPARTHERPSVINLGPKSNGRRQRNAVIRPGAGGQPGTHSPATPMPGNSAHHFRPGQSENFHSRLEKLGVHEIPHPISHRFEILDTDRRHSEIRLPDRGEDHRPLAHTIVQSREFSHDFVRGHMTIWANGAAIGRIRHLNNAENRPDHYYWHHEGGDRYCHYLDPWGFHWYGWYVGTQCFWTRFYMDRWWFYDRDMDRWCYWNNGWWWQDPYHVGDVYYYNEGSYVPSNAGQEQVVTSQEPAETTVFRSNDGIRMVKILGNTADAFLYDTAIPPEFNPMYLASKVKEVRFSGSGEGLEITLILSDGSTDLFDSQGQPLSFRDEAPAKPGYSE